MNVLVLTPDRVGSTLLQKIITLTMQMHDYDKPVINLHELTNGLERYTSKKYNQEVLGKPQNPPWGYHQSLKEIVQLLIGADHYKVGRVAQYHMLNRKDLLEDQLSFYEYINKNFYLISARRENLLEHALSWCIFSFTKSLNVYTHEEKISTFKGLHEKKITIDQEVFIKYLNKYITYLKWVDDHFMINSIFNYEQDMPNLETYINQLDIFPTNAAPKSWKQGYGISWNDWNRCHYLISDTIGSSKSITSITGGTQLANPKNTNLLMNSTNIKKLITRNSLSVVNQNFLQENIRDYLNVYLEINKLIIDRTIVHGVPIKIHTLAEKAVLIKNFKQCVDTYNDWSSKHPNQHKVTLQDLGQMAYNELETWYNL